MKRLLKYFFVVCAIFSFAACSTSSGGGEDEPNPQQKEEESENGKKTDDEEQTKGDESQVLDSSTYVRFVNNSSYAVTVYYNNLPSEGASPFAEVEEYDRLSKQIAVSAKETTTANFFFEYNIPLGAGSEKYKYFLNASDSQFRKSQPLYKDKTETNPNEIIIDELNTVDDRLETKSSFLLLKNQTTSAVYLLAKDAPIIPYGKTDRFIDSKESAFYEIGEDGQLSVEGARSAKVFVNSNPSYKIDFSQIAFDAGKVYTVIVKSESEAEIKPATFFPSSGEVCAVYFENPKNTEENKTIEVVQGKTLSEEQLATPQEIPGYSFDGWYLNERKFTTSQSIRSDITLTVKWSVVTYSIEYALNGGTNASENPASYTIESKEITLENPSLYGYEFKGWYEAEDFSGEAVSEIEKGSAGNKKFYAKWEIETYSVTYNLSGGTLSEENPTRYTIETENFTLKNPTRTGYTFGGWYESSDCSGNVVTEIKQGSTGNKTLYAKWNAITYTITYELNGGANATENKTSYTVADSVTLENPSRFGYEFKGWYEAADFSGNEVTRIQAGSTGDKKFYAKWEIRTYTIAYELNGGTLSEENPTSYTIETENFTLKNPTRTGYTFGGWYESLDFSGTAVSEITKGTAGNKTLYAKWNAIIYAISYELNGGTNATENLASYTIEDFVSLSNPTRTGATFAGWYESSDFSGNAVSSIPMGSTGNKKFYAKWELIAYSITYVLNGGTNASANPATYTVEDSVALENPVRSGQTFLGWYTNSIFSGNKITGIALGSTENKTFYARWDAQSSISVTESALSDITVTKSQSGSTVTFTAETGFSSYKWEVDGTIQSTTSRILELDTTGWAKGSYEVALEAKSGGKTRSAIFYIKVEAN